MNEKIIVDTDKEVIIKRIKQWHTYGGVLEGLPTARVNSLILTEAQEDAKAFCGLDEIFLIEPTQTPIPYEGRYPFGEPIALPSVICIAELWYYTIFRDETKDFSSLGIVWFQNDYAFPIDKEIVEKIKKVPFGKICGEFNY